MFFWGGLVLNTLTLKLKTGGIVNGKGQQRRGGMLGGKSSCYSQILCFRSLDTVPPIELCSTILLQVSRIVRACIYCTYMKEYNHVVAKDVFMPTRSRPR